MKSRSAIFVVVLLLLTVTVCFAQSPMGFSPEEFYEEYSTINTALQGPEVTYEAGDEENGARIVVRDDIYYKLYYTDNNVTNIDLYVIIGSSDEDFGTKYVDTMWSMMATLAVGFGNFSTDMDGDALSESINELMDNGKLEDYCGYSINTEYGSVDNSVAAVYKITKVDDGSASDSSSDSASSSSESSSGSTASVSASEQAFFDLLDDLSSKNVIPDGGTYSDMDDYTDEWAQINWYQWNRFAKLRNFVFSANVSWESAHERPNTFSAGCGLVFRENGTDNMLEVSLRMDGYVYMDGYRSGTPLSYPKAGYGSSQIKATHQFVVVANGGTVTVYVDGVQEARWTDVAIKDNGYMGLATMSGTNKGFGTRCEWTDIYYYTW